VVHPDAHLSPAAVVVDAVAVAIKGMEEGAAIVTVHTGR
jgi:hypothetical protein